MTQLNTHFDPTYYLGTVKGRRIDKLQTKIHDRLVNECTAHDIGQAITNLTDRQTVEFEKCFHASRSNEFYQLVLSLMYDNTLEQAANMALEIGEYEY